MKDISRLIHDHLEYFWPKQSLKTFDLKDWENEDIKQRQPLKDALSEIEVNLVERF